MYIHTEWPNVNVCLESNWTIHTAEGEYTENASSLYTKWSLSEHVRTTEDLNQIDATHLLQMHTELFINKIREFIDYPL